MKAINLGWKYWAVEIFMIALAAYNFWLAALRWGFQDSDLTVAVGAVILAGATEVGLVVFLHLQRAAIYAERRNGWVVLGWMLISGACIAVSLYVNQLYFLAHWHDADGNQLVDQWVRSGFPMVLLVVFACISPKKLRSQAEIKAEYDVKVYEAERKQELAQVESKQVGDRRQRQAAERAVQAQMARIAGKELVAQFTAEVDDDILTDWLGLEQELRAQFKWPPEVANLPTNQQLIATAKASEVVADDAVDEDDERSNSGNHRSYISATEVATILDVTVKVARDLIKSKSTHKYAIKGCKNIRLRRSVGGRSTERRAPYAEVLKIQQRMVAERDEKVRPFPRPQDEQERA